MAMVCVCLVMFCHRRGGFVSDPGCPKRNLTRVISHPKVYDFIDDQIRLCYKYFSIPQLESGPAYSSVQLDKHKVSQVIGRFM